MSVLSTFSGPNRSHSFQHFSVLRPTSHADSSRLLPAFAFPVTVQSIFAIFFIFKCCPLNLLCFFFVLIKRCFLVSLYPCRGRQGLFPCSFRASQSAQSLQPKPSTCCSPTHGAHCVQINESYGSSRQGLCCCQLSAWLHPA